jgi:hypothetical protein
MINFLGVRLDSVDAKREKDAPVKGVGININVEDVRGTGKELMISFVYSVTYEDVGYLKMSGMVFANGTEEEVKEMEDKWKNDKKIAEDVAQPLLNLINYSSGINGVLVTRAINLAPPLIPPRIEVSEKGAKSKE